MVSWLAVYVAPRKSCFFNILTITPIIIRLSCARSGGTGIIRCTSSELASTLWIRRTPFNSSRLASSMVGVIKPIASSLPTRQRCIP
jgi:hypothetical protein